MGLLGFHRSRRPAAWTLPDGTGQWLTTLTPPRRRGYLDGSGPLQSTPRYNKDELQALIEYGVTDRFTAIVAPGLQHIDIASPTDAERTGLGYTEFGARYAAFESQDKSWVLSGQATTRIPGTFDTSNPAAIGYTDVETDLRVLFGHSFAIAGLPAFVDLEAAERVRTAGLPNEFRADVTFGVWLQPRWLVLAQSLQRGVGGRRQYGLYRRQLRLLQASAQRGLSVHAGVVAARSEATLPTRAAMRCRRTALIFGVWRKF